MTEMFSALKQKLENKQLQFLRHLRKALNFIIEKTFAAFDIKPRKDPLTSLPKLIRAYMTTTTSKLLPKLQKLPKREDIEKLCHPDTLKFLTETSCVKFIKIGNQEVAVPAPPAFLLLKIIPENPNSLKPLDLLNSFLKENQQCWNMTATGILTKVHHTSKLQEKKLEAWEAFTVLFLLMCGATAKRHAMNYREGTEFAIKATNELGKTFVQTLTKASNGKIKISMPRENDIVTGVFRKKLWKLAPKIQNLLKQQVTKKGGYTYYLDIENPDGSIDQSKLEFLVKKLKESSIGPYLKQIFKELKKSYEQQRTWLKDAGGKHDPLLLINLELLIEEEL